VELASLAVLVAVEASDVREIRRRAEAAVAKPEVRGRDELPEALGEHGAARGAARRQTREDLVGNKLVSEHDGLVVGRHVSCDQRTQTTGLYIFVLRQKQLWAVFALRRYV
jgi:hypothetical protein